MNGLAGTGGSGDLAPHASSGGGHATDPGGIRIARGAAPDPRAAGSSRITIDGNAICDIDLAADVSVYITVITAADRQHGEWGRVADTNGCGEKAADRENAGDGIGGGLYVLVVANRVVPIVRNWS